MRRETHRLNPVGFSLGRVLADVIVISQELCAARRTMSGRQGSHGPAGEGDPGVGGIDRSDRRKSKEDEQVGLSLVRQVTFSSAPKLHRIYPLASGGIPARAPRA